MELLTIVFAIAAILLFIAAAFEFREYRRYVKAAHGVMALAESLQISFGEVGEHLNRINMRTIALSQGLNLTEQQINLVIAIMQIHSEALNLKGLEKSFELQSELQKMREDDGENSLREISR